MWLLGADSQVPIIPSGRLVPIGLMNFAPRSAWAPLPELLTMSRTHSSLYTSDIAGLGEKPVSDNPGGLKGSMQHWLAVYPPEFEIPMFFVAVD